MSTPYKLPASRLMAVSLVISLVPLYLLGWIIYTNFANTYMEQQKTRLVGMAQNRVSAISLFLDERISLMEVLTQTSSLKELTSPGALQDLFQLLNRRNWTFLDLGIIDSEGRHLAYVGPYPLEKKNYKDAHWFQKTIIQGVYISDVFLGFRGIPHFVVAVKKGTGPESWVLRATIDSDVFTRLVRSAQLGKHGDAYIVNSEGLYQTTPRFGGEVLWYSKVDIKAVPRGTSLQERTLTDGRHLLTTYAWLPEKDWLLVIDHNLQEAQGPLNLTRNMELTIMGLGTLFIALVIFWLVRIMVRQQESQERKRLAMDAKFAHSARLVSLGRMAAGVAHEINNPLAAIGELAGLSDDLMDEAFVKKNEHGSLFKENMIKIGEHVERARKVTHRLLGFARRMEPRFDKVSVNDLLEDAFSFLEKEANLRGVRVSRNLAGGLPQIKSDKSQLQQVVLNILTNALDAVDDGGQIILTTRQTGDAIEVAITDDGKGIPKEMGDKIFEPFFTTKSPGEGTGLGLSISFSIMENLGGSLSFQNEPGRGTTFTIEIPKVLA